MQDIDWCDLLLRLAKLGAQTLLEYVEQHAYKEARGKKRGHRGRRK